MHFCICICICIFAQFQIHIWLWLIFVWCECTPMISTRFTLWSNNPDHYHPRYFIHEILFLNFSEITMITALNLNIKNRYTNTKKYHCASETLVRCKWWINKSKFVALENKWKKNTWKKDDDFFPHFLPMIFFWLYHTQQKRQPTKMLCGSNWEKKLSFFSEKTWFISWITWLISINEIGSTMIFSFSCNSSIVSNTN